MNDPEIPTREATDDPLDEHPREGPKSGGVAARLAAAPWLVPFGLAVAFTTGVQTLGLSEFLPIPLALLAGVGWGVAIGLLAVWIRNKARPSAWVEDVLVGLGVTAMAFFAFGGAASYIIMRGALESPSVTGETVVSMFVPSIPLVILANVPTELVVIPVLLVLGWREGRRRFLIVAAAALYCIHRVWTYLAFASARLDFAETEGSTTPLSEAERTQLAADLQVDDPRWLLNLAIFALLLLAAYLSRVGELNAATRRRARRK